MNIIIPLGGKGERFKNAYCSPKPLIKILDKCMIEYVFNNLKFSTDDNIFIIYNEELDNYDFSAFILNVCPQSKLIKIKDTKGAAETLYIGLSTIIQSHVHKKTLVLDCDTFYTEDIVNIFKGLHTNVVFYTKNYNLSPIYSYIELNQENDIVDIQEKNKISDNANTGAYGFIDILTLYEYCKRVIDLKICFKNEPYTSCVISEMLKNKHWVKGYELNEKTVYSLGTPNDVEKYIQHTHAFMFDLDGTMVITDDIYFEVWCEILIKYNIVLSKEIFHRYIQGNNDKHVLNTLLKNMNIDIKTLSKIKDELFILNIEKIKIVNGLIEALNTIKKMGHKICIITNCNCYVANAIVQQIKIKDMVDFIISAEDCLNGKPHPEPYNIAMQKYGISKNKCIIFEDSKTGIVSGKSVFPKLLVGLQTTYSHNTLIDLGANVSILNYAELNIEDLIKQNSNIVDYITKLLLKNSTIGNIKKIILDRDKLKGGFIADILSFQVITNENAKISQILKYESENENDLSLIANKLKLYEREYYFYETISHTICIKTPKYYNMVLDNKNKKIGIVLENLFEKNMKNNLDLNIESIDVVLKIVNRMAKLHACYWNKDLKTIFPRLHKNNDETFCPFMQLFINEKYELFKSKWFPNLNKNQQFMCDNIFNNFDKIQEKMSTDNLTFIHGDIKSPNIFYDKDNDNEPYFIDWQHCIIGKGVQDLVFFIIESFDIANLKSIYNISKEYYYKKIVEYGILNYTFEMYEADFNDAICYIPFFTSIWFGTTPQDELIDKNFPYFFINKFLYLLEMCDHEN